MDLRAGQQKWLRTKELMPSKSGVGRLLRVTLTARRSNQLVLKEINPEYSLEGLMLKVMLRPSDAKSWLIWKCPDAGKDRSQEGKGTTEDEMVGWHYQLNGHEFKQSLRDGERQGSLVCCSPWGHKESDMTEQLENNNTASIHNNLTHLAIHILTMMFCGFEA